jgi:YD repeat-containing protein
MQSRPVFALTLILFALTGPAARLTAQETNTPVAAPRPAAPAYDKRLIPPWANTAEPVDPGNHADYDPSLGDLPDGGGQLFDQPGHSFGPSDGMQVNLATGTEEYVPDPDMTGHNSIGTDAVFRRAYRSDRALAGYGSPGLSLGWVHNYDVTLSAISPGKWEGLVLNHCAGCNELLKPTLDATGQPTGKFQTGMPCEVVGQPGAVPGQWSGISLTWRDRTHWLFLPFGNGTYVLSGITNLAGNGFYLQWDEARRLRMVVDTKAKKPLLTLLYDTNGHLTDIKDILGLTVHYRFGPVPGQPMPALLAVSTPFDTASPKALARYQFSYFGSGPLLLHTISVPDPGGPGLSTSTIQYGAGKVTAHIDAEGNQHILTYADGHTRVEVKGPDGKVAQFWTQNFDTAGRDIGITDALGHSTHISY